MMKGFIYFLIMLFIRSNEKNLSSSNDKVINVNLETHFKDAKRREIK